MTNIIRVGVTFPPELLEDLDKTIEKMGYDSRSKAIQDAVREFILEHKQLREEVGSRVGVLMMIYNHTVKGLQKALTDIQHEHGSVICSTMHIHLSKRDCLEAIAVRGEAIEIRKLAEELKTKRGVKLTKLMLAAP